MLLASAGTVAGEGSLPLHGMCFSTVHPARVTTSKMNSFLNSKIWLQQPDLRPACGLSAMLIYMVEVTVPSAQYQKPLGRVTSPTEKPCLEYFQPLPTFGPPSFF